MIAAGILGALLIVAGGWFAVQPQRAELALRIARAGRDRGYALTHSVVPAPAPIIPEPLSDSARARVFQVVVGPYIPVWASASLGGAFGRYERDFVVNDERQWAANGPAWAEMNYYDRAAIYYAWYARTGDLKYLSRANALAVDYRKNYLETANFVIQAHWSMMDGVALHYLMTGDEASRSAVGKVADLFVGLTYRNNIGLRTATDNRIQARYLVALMLADLIRAPSVGIGAPAGIPGGHDWKAELRRALPLVLATQDADGAWRLACSKTRPVTHPFTTGLLMDAMARYYDLFEPDPRIPPAIKRSADFLWANDWVAGQRAFRYIGGQCQGEGAPAPAADLNNLLVNAYGWIYRQTKDVDYRRRGDEIFAGAVTGAWISPTKQFNQVYSSSYRYEAYTRPELQRDTTRRTR
ncbi:MAG TPA: hypothetical protein VM076_26030 [Gemmatimonadaceae bacterium]|nr:hypothetical protein [Gemmatimonadaceae bacterium]